jgi:hypothetical protein
VALGSFGGSELAGQIWFWRYDGQAYDRIEHMAMEGMRSVRNLFFADMDDDFRPDLVHTTDALPTIHVLEQRH